MHGTSWKERYTNGGEGNSNTETKSSARSYKYSGYLWHWCALLATCYTWTIYAQEAYGSWTWKQWNSRRSWFGGERIQNRWVRFFCSAAIEASLAVRFLIQTIVLENGLAFRIDLHGSNFIQVGGRNYAN